MSPALSEKGFFDDSMQYQHTFLIEQFLSSDGNVRFRRYQSMICQATILQDFNSSRYGDLEEGTWSKEELSDFFTKFKTLYLIHDSNKYASFYECFRYISIELPPYTFDKDVLKGLSIRYFLSPFNPKDAVENLAKFINSSEILKAIFFIND